MKKDMLWGILDQGVLSLMNISVGMLLIHFDTKSHYGFYSLGMSAILLLVGFSNALVSTQMAVIAPTKTKEDFFCGNLILGFFLLFIPLALITVFVFSFLGHIYSFSFQNNFIYSIAFVGPILMFQEIMRRYFFLKLIPKRVFQMDIFYLSIYLLGIYYLIINNVPDMFVFVIIVNGFAALVSSLVFFYKSNLKIISSVKEALTSQKEAWVGGKWALGGVMVSWGQNQGYIYVLGLLKGSEMVAEANAARLFMAPIGLVSTSLSKMILPRLARLKQKSKIHELLRLLRQVLLIILFFIVVYTSILGASLEWIKEYIMTEKYTMLDALIYIWAVYFSFQALRNNNSILLQAFRFFKNITISCFFTSLLVLLVSILVVVQYGVQGVISTMAIGELLLAFVLWGIYRKLLTKY